jgi:hypothetical protein
VAKETMWLAFGGEGQVIRKLAKRLSRLAIPFHFFFAVLLLIAVSFSLAAQEDKGKEEEQEKGEIFTGNVVKLTASLHCQKAVPAHSIEVPDRPGHALMISKRQCKWTTPLVIAGAKTTTGVAVDFAEKMEGRLHIHGFQTDSLDNGEKLTMKTIGQVIGEKGPADDKGRWSLMKGTGKYKGIRGGGTYSGKLDANDELNLSLEGVYLPDSMSGNQKDQEKK